MTFGPSDIPGITIIYPDEGKALVDPNTGGIYCVVGVESADGWTEIDAPDEPTVEDKAEAYDILVGVTE